MADTFLININLKFPTWFAGQAEGVQTAIRNKWNDLGSDPGIVQSHHSADYAKKYELLRFCKDNYGYDFT